MQWYYQQIQGKFISDFINIVQNLSEIVADFQILLWWDYHIMENQILKTINHIKYISKKKPCTLKVGLPPSKKKYFYLLKWKHFTNDEKCFLFHLESSFRSQDI